MAPLAATLLLALAAGPAVVPHYPGASAVFQCPFDLSGDEGFYGWPAGWTRRHGPGFPRYVHMRLDEHGPPPGGGCMQVVLDGGAAAAYGPAIEVNPAVKYVLEGYIQTSGLRYDTAWFSLEFRDATRHALLRTVASEKIGGTSGWLKVQIGPLTPPAGAVSMQVGLHLEPQDEMQDLHGKACFGGIWLGQLPHTVLTARSASETSAQAKTVVDADGEKCLAPGNAGPAFMIFPRGQAIDVACQVSGFPAPAYEIQMQLLDFEGRLLAQHRQPINTSQPAAKTEKQKPFPPALATWRVPGKPEGFYRVRARITTAAAVIPTKGEYGPAGADHRATAADVELSLAIVEPQTLSPDSEFGWSLSPGDTDLGLAPLADLLSQSGIRWVKFPFVIHADATHEQATLPGTDGAKGKPQGGTKPELPRSIASDSIEPLVSFNDRLGRAGVGLAGVLQPPRDRGDAANLACDVLAAEFFARDPKIWYPSIEPLQSRLAAEIRSWQIGDDRDPGWIGCRDLTGIVARTKGELDRIGQDVSVGVPWNLAVPLPVASIGPTRPGKTKTPTGLTAAPHRPAAPWRFLCLPCDEATDDDTLAHCLDSAKAAGVLRWITIAALPHDGHAVEQRISQLVGRMVTAKMHGAEGIFVADPLDGDRGLVGRNGSPGDLFFPWRTTALLLGGKPYRGDIELPRGNRIHCFGGDGGYVGVLAGGKPERETAYLGPELQTQDLWGNRRPCPATLSAEDRPIGPAPTPQSVIAVESLPTFLVGLDGPVTQWQLDAAFSPSRLASIPSTAATVTLVLKNSFPQAVSGRVSIRGPQNWSIEPRTAEFHLDPAAAWKQPLEVVMPNDVIGGRQLVRLDFEIQADRLHRFTMFAPLEVTLGDVTFAGRAVLNQMGDLEVRQTLINLGKKPAAFRCHLIAPDVRRQSSEIYIQPAGKSETTYRVSDGERLLGKTIWLRAEEIDGPRVLNYRLEIAPADRAASPADEHKPPRQSRPGTTLVL